MTAAQRAAILPASLPPIGINREQAAAFINVSPPLFDRMVAAGTMPEPRVVGGRLVYDVHEIVEAFRRLPHRGSRDDSLDGDDGSANPWD